MVNTETNGKTVLNGNFGVFTRMMASSGAVFAPASLFIGMTVMVASEISMQTMLATSSFESTTPGKTCEGLPALLVTPIELLKLITVKNVIEAVVEIVRNYFPLRGDLNITVWSKLVWLPVTVRKLMTTMTSRLESLTRAKMTPVPMDLLIF